MNSRGVGVVVGESKVKGDCLNCLCFSGPIYYALIDFLVPKFGILSHYIHRRA